MADATPCRHGHRYKPCSCFYEEVRDHNLMRRRQEDDPKRRKALTQRIDGAQAAADRLRRLGS